MNSVVVDSTALLAYLNAERGGDAVESLLPDALISAVTVAEVVAHLMIGNQPREIVREIMDILNLDVVALDESLAEATGALALLTRALGLSLGDRACLALAMREHAPVVTADRAWAKLDLGIDIRLIR